MNPRLRYRLSLKWIIVIALLQRSRFGGFWPVTTAEALDGITDESAFELLAVRALRELEPECHSLVHLGMNLQGKTIRSPLDGFRSQTLSLRST